MHLTPLSVNQVSSPKLPMISQTTRHTSFKVNFATELNRLEEILTIETEADSTRQSLLRTSLVMLPRFAIAKPFTNKPLKVERSSKKSRNLEETKGVHKKSASLGAPLATLKFYPSALPRKSSRKSSMQDYLASSNFLSKNCSHLPLNILKPAEGKPFSKLRKPIKSCISTQTEEFSERH